MKLALLAAIAVLYQGEPRSEFTTVPPPGIRYRMNMATATSAPWIDSNIWRYRREPDKHYLMTLKERPPAALAMAEAHSQDVELALELDAAQKAGYEAMRTFLAALPEGPKTLWTNLALSDDGSPMAGEVLNLLTRRNLLLRITTQPKPGEMRVALTKSIQNPYDFAQDVRQKLGDDHRYLRIYGSELVIATLAREGNRVRLMLVQYGERPVESLRIRLRGHYPLAAIRPYVFGVENPKLSDHLFDGDSTEFFLDRLPTYAVLDLTDEHR